MILGYFDKMHYDIFYHQESKKSIYLTKEGKEREIVPKLAIPMWKNKIAKDQKTIYDLFAIPIAIKYCSDTRKKNQKRHTLSSFLSSHWKVKQNAHKGICILKA